MRELFGLGASVLLRAVLTELQGIQAGSSEVELYVDSFAAAIHEGCIAIETGVS